jgi:HEPN domain-containing protein
MSVDDPKAWFRKAENDLLGARNNLAASEIPWDVVTFHAQQAGEKYLKGFIAFHKGRPPKIHDLARLLDLCLAYDASLETLRNDCIELTDAGFRARYPDMPDEPVEVDARLALAMANRIRDTIQSRASSPQADAPEPPDSAP